MVRGYDYERGDKSHAGENLFVGSRFKRSLVRICSSVRAAKHDLPILGLDAGGSLFLHVPDHVVADCFLDLHNEILAIPVNLNE